MPDLPHIDPNVHFSNQTLLIVEDDIYNAEYLKEILSDMGLNVLHTPFGKEAVALATRYSIDLILMDIRLTDLDGYAATQQIRKHNAEVKIIAQTAYASQNERQKALEAGCNEYISKPIHRELLLSMIQRQLSHNPQL